MKMVIFDGVSGSGKSTLCKSIAAKFDFNILTVDRFTPSVWVYDTLRGIDRSKDIIEYEKMFDNYISPILIVCLCNETFARSRDIIKDLKYEYSDEKKYFQQYFFEISQFKNKIILDTGDKSIEQCVNIISERLK